MNLQHLSGSLGTSMNLMELTLWALALIECLIRLGEGTRSLYRRLPGLAQIQVSVSWLLGIALLGTTCLAIGLCGLLVPTFLYFVILLLILTGSERPFFRLRLWAVFRPPGGWRSGWNLVPVTSLVILIGIVGSPTMFTNAYGEDALVYHLGFPWQALQLHRIPLSNVSMLFHQALLVDMSYVVAICLGDDRLAKVICDGTVAAGGMFAAAWLTGRGLASIRWLPLLFFITADDVLACAIGPKNDLAATAYFMVGALLWRERKTVLGSLLMGSAVATKMTCAPIVLAWVAFFPPRIPAVWSRGILFFLPIIPWVLKSWLVTGDPVFPAGYKLMNTPFWNSLNQTALSITTPLGAASVKGGILGWAWDVLRKYPIFLAALPFLWRSGRHREVAALVIGGTLGLLFIAYPRYLMPAFGMEGIMIAIWCGRLYGRWSTLSSLFLAAMAAGQLIYGGQLKSIRWDHLLERASRIRAMELTTYGETIKELNSLQAKRILMVGAWRSYLLPTRVLFNGVWGETPLVWSIVKDSETHDRLLYRFRQLGVSHIIENAVSVEMVLHFQGPFKWNERMLRLYYKFCRQRLETLSRPSKIDNANGGFYLFRVNYGRSPLNDSDPFFLPGAEAVLADADNKRLAGLHETAKVLFAKILAIVPAVGFFRSKSAVVYAEKGEWSHVHELLRPAASMGYIDRANLIHLGFAAMNLDRLDEAIQMFERCVSVYERHDGIHFNLASLHEMRAESHIKQGRWEAVGRDLDRAESILARIPSSSTIVDKRHRGLLTERIARDRKSGRDR